jgi:hypothetical protein
MILATEESEGQGVDSSPSSIREMQALGVGPMVLAPGHIKQAWGQGASARRLVRFLY